MTHNTLQIVDINLLPLPIALRIEAFNKYKDSFRQAWLIKDLTEILIKFHASVILASYFDQKQDKVSDLEIEELRRLLEIPHLGEWLKLSEDYFNKSNNRCFITELNYKTFKDYIQTAKKLKDFRNDLAHGAVPPDDECAKDVNKYLPLVNKLLGLKHLTDYHLVLTNRNGIPQKATGNSLEPLNCDKTLQKLSAYLFNKNGQCLNLFPFMTYRPYENEEQLFFYNDFKRFENVTLLNYETAVLYKKDEEFKLLVREFFRKNNNESITNPNDNYKYLDYNTVTTIRDLSDHFIGREKDLEELERFVSTDKSGFMFILGDPGIGKTSLISKFSELCLQNKFSVKPVFIRKGRLQETSEILFQIASNLDHRVDGINDKGFYSNKIKQSLSYWSNQNKKIILIIDGLDEASNSKELFRFLPDILPTSCIKIILCSRNNIEVERYYEQINYGQRNKKILGKLSRENIRTILYQYVNKYEIEEEHISLIVKKSDYNPLYLVFLCKEIEGNKIDLSTLDKLPDEFYGFYKNRLKGKSTKELQSILFTLAASKELLPKEIIAEISGIDPFEIDTFLDETSDLLRTERDGNNTIKYQLFHTSLLEFLSQALPDKLIEYKMKFLDFCKNYNLYIKGSIKFNFAIKNLPSYLKDANVGNKNEYISLAYDLYYLDLLKEVKGGIITAYDLFESASRELNSGNTKELLALAENIDFFENQVVFSIKELIDYVKAGNYREIINYFHHIKNYEILYLRILLVTMCKYPQDAERIALDNHTYFEKSIKLKKQEKAYFNKYFEQLYLPKSVTSLLSVDFSLKELEKTNKLFRDLIILYLTESQEEITKNFIKIVKSYSLSDFNALKDKLSEVVDFNFNYNDPSILKCNRYYKQEELDKLLSIYIIRDFVHKFYKDKLSKINFLKELFSDKYKNATNEESIFTCKDFDSKVRIAGLVCFTIPDQMAYDDKVYFTQEEIRDMISVLNETTDYIKFFFYKIVMDKVVSNKISPIIFPCSRWDLFATSTDMFRTFTFVCKALPFAEDALVKIEIPLNNSLHKEIDSLKESIYFYVGNREKLDDQEYEYYNNPEGSSDKKIRKEINRLHVLVLVSVLSNFDSEAILLLEHLANLQVKRIREKHPNIKDPNNIEMSQKRVSFFSSIEQIKRETCKVYHSCEDIYYREINDGSYLPLLLLNNELRTNKYFIELISSYYKYLNWGEDRSIKYSRIYFNYYSLDWYFSSYDLVKIEKYINSLVRKNCFNVIASEDCNNFESEDSVLFDLINRAIDTVNKLLTNIEVKHPLLDENLFEIIDITLLEQETI
jgi:hypothetical protein